jgi:hypothetical protein
MNETLAIFLLSVSAVGSIFGIIIGIDALRFANRKPSLLILGMTAILAVKKWVKK